MRRRRAAVAVAGLALTGALVAGCGEDDEESDRAGSSAGGTTTTAADGGPARAAAIVNITDFRFEPGAVSVTRGGSVTWVNGDKAPHTAENKTVEGSPEEFETGRLDLGDRKKVTFAKAGTYTYYCVFHRFMEADVVVK